MRSHLSPRIRLTISVIIATAGGLFAGCAGGGATSPTDDSSVTIDGATVDDVEDERGTSGAADDAIVKPLMAAGATSVEYDGTTLRAHFAGSAADPAAWVYCSSLQLVAPDGATDILVYSDGELDCSERPGYAD